MHTRLGERSFDIEVSPPARQLLLERGFNQEYGARELKRTIHRMLTQPLAALVAEGQVAAGGRVIVDLADSGDALTLRSEARTPPLDADLALQTVLVLDDNPQLLEWLQRELDAGRESRRSRRARRRKRAAGGATSRSISRSSICSCPTAMACPWRSSCSVCGRGCGWW